MTDKGLEIFQDFDKMRSEHNLENLDGQKPRIWNGGGRLVGWGLHHASLHAPCADM